MPVPKDYPTSIPPNPIEEFNLFDPYLQVNKRLAHPIYELCKIMTVREVAWHLRLDWKMVKTIDQRFLERQYGQTNDEWLRILAINEISIRKGHRYLRGRFLWVGKDQKAQTLKKFFSAMNKDQRQALESMGTDMWDPPVLAVQQRVPHVKIFLEVFHVAAQFNRVIHKVRNTEYRNAHKTNKAVFKGTKYLLLKNQSNVRPHKDCNNLRGF
jgi:transposase